MAVGLIHEPRATAQNSLVNWQTVEFHAVAVMACDDEIIPTQSRTENVAGATALEEIYNTERHLLYVACTRARDHLLVTSVAPASEFLDDLRQA